MLITGDTSDVIYIYVYFLDKKNNNNNYYNGVPPTSARFSTS